MDREHEVFSANGFVVERHGRQITIQSDGDPQAHARWADAWLSGLPAAVEERDRAMHRLDEVLRTDPAGCVALASLLYLAKDPETYRESLDDRSPAHVEFLALRALPLLAEKGSSAPNVAALTGEALHLVRGAFADTALILTLQGVNDDSTGDAAHRLRTRQGGLIVRGTAYREHLLAVLDGCLAPFETECREVLGFTAAQAWRLADGVGELIGARMQAATANLPDEYAAARKALKRHRRARRLPAELAALPPKQQLALLYQGLMASCLADPVGIARLTTDSLAKVTGVPADVCAAWLAAMHCPPADFDERHHRHPVGGHPLTRRPLLALPAGGFLAPSPGSLHEPLRQVFETALRAAVGSTWDRYERARGRWVEAEAVRLVAGALPGATGWTGIAWQSPDDDSDLDGLVQADDVAFRIQAKAGSISPAARRGAPSMVEDVRAVITDAVGQHDRLDRALRRSAACDLGFTRQQAAALASPLGVEIVVCLDDVTVWSTHTHRLRGLTGLPSAHRIPWVLSLTDLMAVTDLLQGAELVHFVTRRLRLEALELVEAHDELDWVGNYLRDGLYFDGFLDGPNPPGRFRLLSFTEDIDSWYFSRAGLLREPAPKPCQKVPLGMSRLLRRLEAERPAHWLTASTVLLNGDDDSRRTIDAQLAHTQAKANADGWSNASQVFLPHYGVTFWTDFRRQPGSQIAAVLASYMTGKMAQHNVAFWVGVGLGTDGALVVGLVVTGPSVVADALLRPLLAHDLGRSDTADPDHDAPARTPRTPKTPPRGFST